MGDTLSMRVSRVIAASIHALIDKIEDQTPLAIMDQHVRELDQIAAEVRTELGRVTANRHLSQQQHVRLNEEHTQLAQAIESALSSGREDLASTAIGRQLDIEAQLPVLENSLTELSAEESRLVGFTDALMGKRREMQDAISAYEQSRKKAEKVAGVAAQGSLEAKVMVNRNSFDRHYQRQTGLSPLEQQASLEQTTKLKELGDMIRQEKINQRLASLKGMQ